MKKIILFLAIACFAAEWQTYRCIADMEVVSSGFSTSTLSTIVCKKSGAETWTRTTQIKPEKGRFIAISKGPVHATYFPEQGLLNKGNAADDPMEELFRDLMAQAGSQAVNGGCQDITLPENKALKDLGARQLRLCRQTKGNTTTDSITIIDSTQTPSSWIILVNGVSAENGNSYPLPNRITFRSARVNLIVNTRFSAYRVNDAVPDETFELNDVK